MQNDLTNISHSCSNDDEELYFEVSCLSSYAIKNKEKQELINNALKKLDFSKDICDVISIIKTVYSDQIIKGITLCIYGDDERELKLKYNEEDLVLYESKHKLKNGVVIKNQYDIKIGTQFNLNDDNNTIKSLTAMETYNSIATTELKNIYELKNVKARELSKNDRVLCTIYKDFYGEDPDYSKETTKTKTHAMLSILSYYGIVLGKQYLFSVTEKNKIPFSICLTELMENLVPFGKINLQEKNATLHMTEKVKKIVRITGREIRENINSEEELIARVNLLSTILHAKKYMLAPTAGLEEISNYINFPKEETGQNIKLIKKINSTLKKNG